VAGGKALQAGTSSEVGEFARLTRSACGQRWGSPVLRVAPVAEGGTRQAMHLGRRRSLPGGRAAADEVRARQAWS
jgi:hypothetical protein